MVLWGWRFLMSEIPLPLPSLVASASFVPLNLQYQTLNLAVQGFPQHAADTFTIPLVSLVGEGHLINPNALL